MSETTLYAILFFGTFPALWLLAWWLDRVLPNPKAKGEEWGGSHDEH